MTPEMYETMIGRFDMSPKTDWYYALKMNGEAGEVAEIVGKAERLGAWRKPIEGARVNELILELGDVLWYVTRLANKYGYSLAQVMDLNVDKLMRRFEASEEGRLALAEAIIRES